MYRRQFRRKNVDFTSVMDFIQHNERVKAKMQIDQIFQHLTKAKVGYGILKMIEEKGDVPSNEEIEKYIVQVESNDSRRQLQSHRAITSTTPEKTNACIPKCPTCGSTKLTKQTIVSRGISGFLFGRHSVEGRAQFWCNNCGYQW